MELNETSGSGGNRTHVHLLKRQAPRQRRTHFRSGPEGNRTPVLLLDRETATPLARGTVLAITNHESAGGGGIEPRRQSRRFWRPSAFPDAITTCSELSSTPCGSRTRPKRLERPPTSPEVERGTAPRTQKKKPAGGRFYPRPARMPLHGVPGVIRSYPVDGAHPYPNPLRSYASRRDIHSSQP